MLAENLYPVQYDGFKRRSENRNVTVVNHFVSFTLSENNRPSRNGKQSSVCVGVRNSIPTADELIENDRNNNNNNDNRVLYNT